MQHVIKQTIWFTVFISVIMITVLSILAVFIVSWGILPQWFLFVILIPWLFGLFLISEQRKVFIVLEEKEVRLEHSAGEIEVKIRMDEIATMYYLREDRSKYYGETKSIRIYYYFVIEGKNKEVIKLNEMLYKKEDMAMLKEYILQRNNKVEIEPNFRGKFKYN